MQKMVLFTDNARIFVNLARGLRFTTLMLFCLKGTKFANYAVILAFPLQAGWRLGRMPWHTNNKSIRSDFSQWQRFWFYMVLI